jgi:acyl-CoA synthetase (AMP-forming)/AMP-acid ligase II
VSFVSDAPGYLFWPAWKRQDREALRIEDGRSYTFGELDRRAAGFAHTLSEHAAAGDRVGILAEPSVDVVVALLGCYRAGCIAVPINTRYREQEIGHILRDSGATILVHDPHDALRATGPTAVTRQIQTGAELEAASADTEPRSLPITGKHGALIIYTSGTTGKSKGVLLTFEAVVDNMRALTGLWQWAESDVLSLSLPLFHVHGLCIGIHGAILNSMPVLLHRRFDPAAVVADFSDRGATVFMGVPTMYARLLAHMDEHPEAADALGRGRLFTSGSAALPARHMERFEALTGHRILERYGMSETLITLSNPHDGERRPGSVGLPVPGCTIRIVDERGREVTGEPGEILVESNGMMAGYWNQPEATAASFAGDFFRTGDIAVREPDGYVRIVGRKSVDIIKSGGFKISAREIEDVLREHPDVVDAAVVGIPDETWGERIVAAVVTSGGLCDRPDAEQSLADHVAGALADYKKPRQVKLVDDLPRNALGKVQKHRLRALFAG